MSGANRHYIPGHLWHITHRCHNRDFLFKSQIIRKTYLSWLYEARKKYDLSILNYMVTSNHVHILMAEKYEGSISLGMQCTAGRFAQEFNFNSRRSGAFWEDRYHATIIDSGIHLIKCLIYIDLNMVRAGKVKHPKDWKESGYHELIMEKQRYRLIDIELLCKYTGFDVQWMKNKYPLLMNEELSRNTSRNPIWTKSLAVGRRHFLIKLKSMVNRNRKNLKFSQSPQEGFDDVCVLH